MIITGCSSHDLVIRHCRYLRKFWLVHCDSGVPFRIAPILWQSHLELFNFVYLALCIVPTTHCLGCYFISPISKLRCIQRCMWNFGMTRILELPLGSHMTERLTLLFSVLNRVQPASICPSFFGSKFVVLYLTSLLLIHCDCVTFMRMEMEIGIPWGSSIPLFLMRDVSCHVIFFFRCSLRLADGWHQHALSYII